MLAKSHSKIGLASFILLTVVSFANVGVVNAENQQGVNAHLNSGTLEFTGYGASDSKGEAANQAQMDAQDQLAAWVLANPNVPWIPLGSSVDFAPEWTAECEIEILILF